MKFSRWSWYTTVVCILFVAAVVSAGRYFTPMLREYRHDLDRWLEQTLGQDVEIGDLAASWHGLGPAISITNLRLTHDNQTLLALPNITIKLSLLNLLFRQTILPEKIYIHGGELHLVQQQSGRFTLAGMDENTQDTTSAIPRQVAALFNSLHYAELNKFDLFLTTKHGEQQKFADLAANFSNVQHESRFHISYRKPDKIAQTIRFTLSAQGDWEDWPSLQGIGHIETKNAPYSLLSPWLADLALPIKFGIVTGKFWFDWHGFQVDSALLQLGKANFLVVPEVPTKHHQDRATVNVDVAGNFAWKNEAEDGAQTDWILHGDQLAIKIGSDQLVPKQFSLQYQQQAGATIWHWRSEVLQIKALGALFFKVAQPYLPLPTGLAKAELTGTLANVDWQFVQHHHGISDHHFQADLIDLSSQPNLGVPGFSGVNGHLVVFPQAGQLQLTSNHFQLIEPKIFGDVLQLGNVAGELNWMRNGGGWHIEGKNLEVTSTDLGLVGSFGLELGENMSKPKLDLVVQQVQPLAAAQVYQYLPWRLFQPKLASWLKMALQGGQFNHGSLLWRGEIAKAPYVTALEDSDDSVFKANIEWQDARFKFHAQWPELTKGMVALSYQGQRLDALVTAGDLSGIKLQQAKAWLPNLVGHHDEDLRLELTANAKSNLAQVKPFLAATPLWITMQDELAGIELLGAMDLQVDLGISLDHAHDYLAVNGVIVPHNGQVKLLAQHLDFTNLNGAIKFTEHNISADNLTAQLWQQPVQAKISPEQDEQGVAYTKFSGTSSMAIAKLKQHYPGPWWNSMVGGADVEVSWNNYKAGGGTSELVIISDLQGVAIDLPAPLVKPAKEQWPLNLRIAFPKTARGPIVTGDLILGAVSNAEKLTAAAKLGEEQLVVTLGGDILQGTVYIPTAASKDKLSFDLVKCRLDKVEPVSTAPKKLVPRDLLPFSGSCQESKLWGWDFGRVNISTETKKNTYTIPVLQIKNKDFAMNAQASWDQEKAANHSTLQGEVSFKNVAKLLASFGIISDIETKSGKIYFNLTSRASPLAKDLKSWQGNVALRLGEGRLVDVQPGVGRFISLFSFQNLQRRLRLDFSDVFKEGLSFDSLTGDFVVDQGIAYTSNTALSGSSVYIEIYGRTDLVNETLDLELEVIPNVSGTFPIAAAVATGNPAIGAAVWIFDQLLSSRSKKLTSYKYRITGPFSSPTIQQR